MFPAACFRLNVRVDLGDDDSAVSVLVLHACFIVGILHSLSETLSMQMSDGTIDRSAFTDQGTGAAIPLALIGAYVLSQFLARTIGQICGLLFARAEHRMFRSLSERLFAYLMKLPPAISSGSQNGCGESDARPWAAGIPDSIMSSSRSYRWRRN
jgi:hypothetical protein